MKFSKKKFSEVDDSILDELIGKCEGAMVNPLKKKVSVDVVKMDPEDEESSEHEESEVPEGEDEDLSEEDKQKLLEIYTKLKG